MLWSVTRDCFLKLTNVLIENSCILYRTVIIISTPDDALFQRQHRFVSQFIKVECSQWPHGSFKHFPIVDDIFQVTGFTGVYGIYYMLRHIECIHSNNSPNPVFLDHIYPSSLPAGYCHIALGRKGLGLTTGPVFAKWISLKTSGYIFLLYRTGRNCSCAIF